MEHQRRNVIWLRSLIIAYISHCKIEVICELSRSIHDQDMAHQLVGRGFGTIHVTLVDLITRSRNNDRICLTDGEWQASITFGYLLLRLLQYRVKRLFNDLPMLIEMLITLLFFHFRVHINSLLLELLSILY